MKTEKSSSNNSTSTNRKVKRKTKIRILTARLLSKYALKILKQQAHQPVDQTVKRKLITYDKVGIKKKDYLLKSKNLPLIMVFRRKFLYGGRQENYFHVKILILVCSNMTCRKFAGKYLPPFHEIFVQEIPIQKCFGPEFFYMSTDFQSFCCTSCDKLDA